MFPFEIDCLVIVMVYRSCLFSSPFTRKHVVDDRQTSRASEKLAAVSLSDSCRSKVLLCLFPFKMNHVSSHGLYAYIVFENYQHWSDAMGHNHDLYM